MTKIESMKKLSNKVISLSRNFTFNVKRVVSKFNTILPYTWWLENDFEIYRWNASRDTSVSIKKTGRNGLLNLYDITVAAIDDSNRICAGTNHSLAREFEITIKIESLLSIDKLKSILMNSNELGIIENDVGGMLKFKRGGKNYIVNYTSPTSWDYSYQRGKILDLEGSFLESSRTIKFNDPIVISN